MLRKAAQLFGVVFVLVGILGFIPGITTADGRLLGIFAVDPLHNIIHLVSGIAALAMSGSARSARTFFKGLTVVYGLVLLLGILNPDGPLLGLITHNVADLALHALITLAAAYLGFGPVRDTEGDALTTR